MLQLLLSTTAKSSARLPGVWWVCQGQGECPYAESLNTVCGHHISFPNTLGTPCAWVERVYSGLRVASKMYTRLWCCPAPRQVR